MHKHSRVTDMAEPATVEITPKAAATEPKGPRIPLIVFMIALDASDKAARMLFKAAVLPCRDASAMLRCCVAVRALV